ncbi:hypothetical protein CC1G_05017 [Coprinopsis cinerea okayama7|uniref:Uncharacterized protein n=1 Tax=Coprinopsis cinerea (strain Okayama-7 / 130 / ATCC MYA-4618 / FGSC 9003) TaxID=240176 RepID=A8NSJ2_COPC7|nr:hypothetical protein CC1G_05017 [Coprinopsis cinerea okayama7\|eukprot:XP_001836024.2 hypothetical protein CC1G_05017 [Coprinopsis cinerea okayama7\
MQRVWDALAQAARELPLNFVYDSFSSPRQIRSDTLFRAEFKKHVDAAQITDNAVDLWRTGPVEVKHAFTKCAAEIRKNFPGELEASSDTSLNPGKQSVWKLGPQRASPSSSSLSSGRRQPVHRQPSPAPSHNSVESMVHVWHRQNPGKSSKDGRRVVNPALHKSSAVLVLSGRQTGPVRRARTSRSISPRLRYAGERPLSRGSTASRPSTPTNASDQALDITPFISRTETLVPCPLLDDALVPQACSVPTQGQTDGRHSFPSASGSILCEQQGHSDLATHQFTPSLVNPPGGPSKSAGVQETGRGVHLGPDITDPEKLALQEPKLRIVIIPVDPKLGNPGDSNITSGSRPGSSISGNLDACLDPDPQAAWTAAQDFSSHPLVFADTQPPPFDDAPLESSVRSLDQNIWITSYNPLPAGQRQQSQPLMFDPLLGNPAPFGRESAFGNQLGSPGMGETLQQPFDPTYPTQGVTQLGQDGTFARPSTYPLWNLAHAPAMEETPGTHQECLPLPDSEWSADGTDARLIDQFTISQHDGIQGFAHPDYGPFQSFAGATMPLEDGQHNLIPLFIGYQPPNFGGPVFGQQNGLHGLHFPGEPIIEQNAWDPHVGRIDSGPFLDSSISNTFSDDCTMLDPGTTGSSSAFTDYGGESDAVDLNPSHSAPSAWSVDYYTAPNEQGPRPGQLGFFAMDEEPQAFDTPTIGSSDSLPVFEPQYLV